MALDANYTGGSVDRFARPVGLVLVLLFAVAPAAAAACQLACARAAAHHQHHADHGDHVTSGHGAHDDRPALRAFGTDCGHLPTAAAAVICVAPATLAASLGSRPITVLPPPTAAASIVGYAAHSPPAARSAPLPLRI